MTMAVVIPVFGKEEFTYPLVEQLAQQMQGFHTYIVDNKGDYVPIRGEQVIRTGSNLRWTKGCNVGIRYVRMVKEPYTSIMLLNNDVRLSTDACAGLRKALSDQPSCGLLAPLYDDVWEHQKHPYFHGDAAEFVPVEREEVVKFVDGTCMVIPMSTINTVGLLDEQNFGEYGWGADFDYSYRVQQTGKNVMVTHRSYLNHFHQGTAKTIDSNWNGLAAEEMHTGMIKKYGENWRAKLL